MYKALIMYKALKVLPDTYVIKNTFWDTYLSRNGYTWFTTAEMQAFFAGTLSLDNLKMA